MLKVDKKKDIELQTCLLVFIIKPLVSSNN